MTVMLEMLSLSDVCLQVHNRCFLYLLIIFTAKKSACCGIIITVNHN
jgi:hypothetical protein